MARDDTPAPPGARPARRFKVASRAAFVRIGVFLLLLAGFFLWGCSAMIRMPGESFRGALPALSGQAEAIRENLRAHVAELAGKIGERNLARPEALAAAERYIASTLASYGYAVERQEFTVRGKRCGNLEAERAGASRAAEIVVVGAHYDTVPFCAGANDNTTGVAALLELARLFKDAAPERTLRFVAFVNEEPPYFQTESMGSRVYAKRCRERNENVVAMVSLETLGYYTDAPGSQRYPFPFSLFYPSTGNFIAFVGNRKSGDLVRELVGRFRRDVQFPCEGAALLEFIPGAGWSDHWSFWQEGYPGLMVTDTAPFRYPHYHQESDTPDKLDYDRFARVVAGLAKILPVAGDADAP